MLVIVQAQISPTTINSTTQIPTLHDLPYPKPVATIATDEDTGTVKNVLILSTRCAHGQAASV